MPDNTQNKNTALFERVETEKEMPVIDVLDYLSDKLRDDIKHIYRTLLDNYKERKDITSMSRAIVRTSLSIDIVAEDSVQNDATDVYVDAISEIRDTLLKTTGNMSSEEKKRLLGGFVHQLSGYGHQLVENASSIDHRTIDPILTAPDSESDTDVEKP